MKEKSLKSTLTLSMTILAVVCIIGFIIFAILVGCKHDFVIDKFNGWIAENRSETTTEFFEAITSLGSFYVVFFVVIITLLIMIFHQKKYRLSAFMCGAFASATLLNVIIKVVFARPRPEIYMIINQSGYSFASGHSVMATSLFLLAIFYICMNIKNKPLKWILNSIFGLLIALVCLSRVYLGVHYVSDVLAGFLLAAGCVLVFMLGYKSTLFKFLKDKRVKNSKQ